MFDKSVPENGETLVSVPYDIRPKKCVMKLLIFMAIH